MSHRRGLVPWEDDFKRVFQPGESWTLPEKVRVHAGAKSRTMVARFRDEKDGVAIVVSVRARLKKAGAWAITEREVRVRMVAKPDRKAA